MDHLAQRAWDGEIAGLTQNLHRAVGDVRRQLDTITVALDRPQDASHAGAQLVVDAAEVSRLVFALSAIDQLGFARNDS